MLHLLHILQVDKKMKWSHKINRKYYTLSKGYVNFSTNFGYKNFLNPFAFWVNVTIEDDVDVECILLPRIALKQLKVLAQTKQGTKDFIFHAIYFLHQQLISEFNECTEKKCSHKILFMASSWSEHSVFYYSHCRQYR